MATSTATLWQAASALSVIVRARLIEFAERSTVIGNLFTVDDTASVRGLVHGVNVWPTLKGDVSNTITEGADETPATITATNVAITPAVVGMLAEITDLLGTATPFAGLDPYLRQMGATVAEELDDDLAGLFPALNGSVAAGTTEANLDLLGFLDALVILQTNQAVAPYFSVLHPRQTADLAGSVGGFTTGGATPFTGISGAGAAGTQTAGLVDRIGSVNGLVGTVAGVPVYSSARVTIVNSTEDRAGCVASPDAITVARKWGIRMETDRHLPGVSNRLLVTTAYGLAETKDNFGVPVESDM